MLLLQRSGASDCQLPTQQRPKHGTRAGKWRGSADVSGVSVEPATQESPASCEASSIEIMEISTVLVGPSTPFIKTVYIADKPFRMLIDSGASHCILKDGALDTSQMSIIQVSARGFDGGAQQRLVPGTLVTRVYLCNIDLMKHLSAPSVRVMLQQESRSI